MHVYMHGKIFNVRSGPALLWGPAGWNLQARPAGWRPGKSWVAVLRPKAAWRPQSFFSGSLQPMEQATHIREDTVLYSRSLTKC